MTRFPIAVLCATAIGVAFVSARQQTIFQAGTHSVPVYATALDSAGRLVTDLTKNDFEVLDNGVKQDLTVFANDVQPITVVVMLDRSKSVEKNFGLVREGAEAFVSNLRPTDKARIGSFSDRVQIDPRQFTSDRDELLRILREEMQPPGITPLWNATAAAMTALSKEDGRRVVLVFTDGFNAPDWRPENVSFAQARDRSQTEGVMVYAIGLADKCEPVKNGSPYPVQPRFQRRRFPIPIGGSQFPLPRGPRSGPIGRDPISPPPALPPPSPPGGRPPTVEGPSGPGDHTGKVGVEDLDRNRPCYESKPDPDLRELASVSGGGYFELTGTVDLSSTFARVADELHHQYLLGFAPAVLDGKLHVLEVRARRAGTIVRARKSYVSTPDPAERR
jgi:VWFA-related protein